MRFLFNFLAALAVHLALAMPAPKRPTATRIPSAHAIMQSASHEALQSGLAEIMNGPLPPFGPIEMPAKRNNPTATRIPSADEIMQSASHEALQSAMAEIMDNSTNGVGFQEDVKEKSMGVMVLRWFEKAHGNSSEKQLLNGYPAELDDAVLDLLKGVRRFDGTEWPRLTAWDISCLSGQFDYYENHTLNFTIGVDDFWNSKEASEAKRHYHSRQGMLSMLERHPALQNFTADQIFILRNFLAEPALGFASRSFGYGCDINDMFPKNCTSASLFAAANQWAKLYPHEARAEPRQDWLTLFEKFQWWTATKTDKKTATEDIIRTMPFREIAEAWEKTFSPPPPPERECDPMVDPFCPDDPFQEEQGRKPLPE